MPRKNTNRLIELAEEGCLTWETIARSCLNYMSEDEVTDMAECNEFLEFDNEAVELEDDE